MVPVLAKDNTRIEVETKVTRGWWNNQEVLIGVTRDVTERNRMVESLRESEERYRFLADNSVDVIWILDLNGVLTYVSPSVIQLRGYTPEEAMHQSLEEMVSPGSLPVVQEAIWQTLAEYTPGVISSSRVTEAEQPCKDGSSVWTEIVTRLLFDTSGKPTGFIGVSRNITERKRADEAFRLATNKLNLLSSITRHDINNQITILMGYMRILEKKSGDPTLNEYIRKVSIAAKRISSMIRFTREYEEIGVNAPVWQDCRMIVANAAEEAPLGKVTINNDLPAGAEVFADQLITKVFYNLMDNAVRYGGKITTIHFSIEERDGGHVIVCEDDGAGIPADEKEKIFERGFGKNTGMGLALSREALDITCITITETGEPGKGARFEMTVPKGMYR
jgi:PAS domain S-box-containing protein